MQQLFQSTLSLRRATPSLHAGTPCHRDFNPRSPCGERPAEGGLTWNDIRFQSTLSLRRATAFELIVDGRALISIHALLAESDSWTSPPSSPPCDFNPRSPCGERPSLLRQPHFSRRFQSTLSLRRATFHVSPPLKALFHFNPRSPCGERHHPRQNNSLRRSFQSTLSLRRATRRHATPVWTRTNFNPRSPCGERRLMLEFDFVTA